MSFRIVTDAIIPVITIGLSPSADPLLFALLPPVQVVGFVPLTSCDEHDCRTQDIKCCYLNKVFGNIIMGVPVTKSTYENDFSSFLLNNQFYSIDSSAAFTWKLEKNINGTWTFKTNLTTSYGLNFPNGYFSNHNLQGYAVNWALVLNYFGAGIYRIKATNSYTAPSQPPTPFPIPFPLPPASPTDWNNCLVSEPFYLRAWNCDLAHGTVKFENYLSGKIGDIQKDYYVHDLCGSQWFDSIRLLGFFGYETKNKYNEVLQEWGPPLAGKIVRVRDEAIKQYEFHSDLLPKYIHDRLSVYGLMAEKILVSDYNINNSDWEIKQMGVIKSGNYAPEYLDKETWPNQINGRKSSVKMLFNRAVQNIVKSECC